MEKHVYDKPVTMQEYDGDTEEYADIPDLPVLHAHINPAFFSTEKNEGKAMQNDVTMDFYLRYFPLLKAVVKRPQLYRLMWEGDAYDLIGGDDYHLTHNEVRLRGVIANGGR